MIKISLHKWVDHYLVKHSPIIGHCISLPLLDNSLINSSVHKSFLWIIFLRGSQKRIWLRFLIYNDKSLAAETVPIYTLTSRIRAGLWRWREGFEGGACGMGGFWARRRQHQAAGSCLLQTVKRGWPLTHLPFTHLEEVEWNKSCPRRNGIL